MIYWNFPPNNDGEELGISNAGIETFSGNPIPSLAREINQNSLDAADLNSGRPVEVHFKIHTVNTDVFPDRAGFQAILESCRSYWVHNPKAKLFFDRAIKILASESISVLKISDYFTTGLTGSDEIRGSNWVNLIKAVGVSDKEGGAGGSFGIGKHAPFACSNIRTLFYSTKDKLSKTAFQGVSKLVTHLNPDGLSTQGTGYCGLREKNAPVRIDSDIPEFFRRTQVGTDLFVFGFDGGANWEDKIVESVLENFFVAIHQRRLIVVVGETCIDDAKLPVLIEKHFGHGSESDCGKYYEAFTSDERTVHTLDDFEGLGGLELSLLVRAKFPKRIAVVRQTGMLVFDKGHFQTPIKFAGVVRATGDKLNELLRSLEPPSHDKWEVQRYENPNYAKRVVNELFRWVRERVKETSRADIEDEYDFDGMQQFLPDDSDDEPLCPSEADGEMTVPREIDVIYRQPAKASQPFRHQPSENAGGEGDGGTATAGSDGNTDGGSNKGGARNGGTTGTQNDPNGIKPSSGGSSGPSRNRVHLNKVRAFCSDQSTGLYQVIFQAQNEGQGHIQLRIVGEVEESIARVKSASLEGESLLITHDGRLGPITFLPAQRQKMLVILENRLHCALEVVAYEN